MRCPSRNCWRLDSRLKRQKEELDARTQGTPPHQAESNELLSDFKVSCHAKKKTEKKELKLKGEKKECELIFQLWEERKDEMEQSDKN